MQSINSGAAVTQEMLCAMLERVELPAAKRLRVKSEGLVGSEPHQGDAQTDSQQAVVVPSQAVVASTWCSALPLFETMQLDPARCPRILPQAGEP